MTLYDYLGAALFVPIAALLLRRLRFAPLWAVVVPLVTSGLFLGLLTIGLTLPQSAASALFIFAYIVIASERVHKTKVALAGAAVMLVFGLIDQHTAFHGHEEVEGTDWNTIFLLIGMMVIVSITRHTGVFQWIAIKAAKLAKGSPVLIMIYLSIATAALSAGLDNVTTVLLIAPVTILICESLGVDPVPFLIAVVLSSNIGGTATLIGDPPNIMIGSSARIGFNDFLIINGPVVLAIIAVFLATIWFTFRNSLKVTPEQAAQVMEFDETRAITDKILLKRCLFVIGAVLIGFGLHGQLGLEPATIALAGAAALLLMPRADPEETLKEVEWPTIFFFVGLFVMVSALVKTGVVRLVGQGIISLTCGDDISGGLDGGQRFALTMGVLWFSAIASGIVDNIPFVATMNAVIHDMAFNLHPDAANADFFQIAHAPDILPLWWALSLGACLGGNFTLVGASANVVVAGIAERSRHPLSFVRFMKYGIPITLQGIILSSIYLWFKFLR